MGQIEPIFFILKDKRQGMIRTAELRDAEAYLKLGKEIMGEDVFTLTQPDELTFTVEQEKDWIQSYSKNPSHLILVAEVGSEIVGQLDFTNGHKRRIAHTGEFGMGVRKDFRGLGIGMQLLGALVSWAKINPRIEKINLCAHSTNQRALELYQKLGFVQEGLRTKDLKYPTGLYVDTVLMGLHV